MRFWEVLKEIDDNEEQSHWYRLIGDVTKSFSWCNDGIDSHFIDRDYKYCVVPSCINSLDWERVPGCHHCGEPVISSVGFSSYNGLEVWNKMVDKPKKIELSPVYRELTESYYYEFCSTSCLEKFFEGLCEES
ncbi:MAG: hypothetical protein GY861_18825 [bacterium]|nr:hypothetical protein [bacterium]